MLQGGNRSELPFTEVSHPGRSRYLPNWIVLCIVGGYCWAGLNLMGSRSGRGGRGCGGSGEYGSRERGSGWEEGG